MLGDQSEKSGDLSSLKNKLQDLDDELKDDLITEKGYWEKKRRLLLPHLPVDGMKRCHRLKENYQKKEINEKTYHRELESLLEGRLEKIGKPESGGSDENNQNTGNTDEGEEECVITKVEESPKKKDGDDEEAMDEDESSKKPRRRRAVMLDSSDEEGKPEDTGVKKEPEEEGEDKSKRPRRSAAGTSQKTIQAMFSSAKRKKEKEEEEDEGKKEGKRPKLDPVAQEERRLKQKCKHCNQTNEEAEQLMFTGLDAAADTPQENDEFGVLFHEKVQILMDGDEMVDGNDKPSVKITNYILYDDNRHIVPFDTGMIVNDKMLNMAGFVKMITSEDSSIADGVMCQKMGPVISWWTTGFDGGDKALLGLSTPYADYYLQEPHDSYSRFVETIMAKMYLSKAVIEFLQEDPNAEYDDLLYHIRDVATPSEVPAFDDEDLLTHAEFIVDQVLGFDANADEDEEDTLIATSCMRELIKQGGVKMSKARMDKNLITTKLFDGSVKTSITKKDQKGQLKSTKAQCTPLVISIFDTMFAGQLDEDSSVPKQKRTRCKVCEFCQAPDCGKCKHCLDMKKFGGPNILKQSCIEKRCPNMDIRSKDDDYLDENSEASLRLEQEEKEKLKAAKTASVQHAFKKIKDGEVEIEWIGEPMKKRGRRYYESVLVNGNKINPGDFCTVKPDNEEIPMYVAKVAYLYEESGKKMFHAQWYNRGNDTVLGECSDPLELFQVDDCQDTELKFCVSTVTVLHDDPGKNWMERGGKNPEDLYPIPPEHRDDGTMFFFQKWYDVQKGRYEDPKVDVLPDDEDERRWYCRVCVRRAEENEREIPRLLERVKNESGSPKKRVNFSAVRFAGNVFRVGKCAYFHPNAFKFNAKQPDRTAPVCVKPKNYDKKEFPELYRKTDYVKGRNDDVMEPFRVATILEIWVRSESKVDTEDPDEVHMRVRKYYRPENTHMSQLEIYEAPLNVIYHSEEEATVTLKVIAGRVTVTSLDEEGAAEESRYYYKDPDHFYYHSSYDAGTQTITPYREKETISKGKGGGKGGKIKGSKKSKELPKEEERPEEDRIGYVNVPKLRTLDVFAGCGGISAGFHEAGIAESCWAIEMCEPAARAYKLNNPKAEVFMEDCNELLKNVMEGEKTMSGKRLPQKGEVDLLCGGPPCQGFSGMNRFNDKNYSKFKNSLISTYLSYLDYYRPRFFLLENVKNFVSYHKNMVLKMTMMAMVKMGYQCTFGILQAGNYGVPQTRRRVILLAAAPGEKLPMYPEPLHTFSAKAMSLNVLIEKVRYETLQKVVSAPYRTITVRDAMSDLPEIECGSKKRSLNYTSDEQTHFQRVIRDGMKELTDHVCKGFSALTEERFKHIPPLPGGDWRNIPNIVVKDIIKDGKGRTRDAKKLEYNYDNWKQGKGKGVCHCNEEDPKNTKKKKGEKRTCDRQANTLIPWCLPHTSERHNHWAGLYGRLEWDGFFSTTVTNPEPMGKQGRVLHPEQHRVVSVRECARSQGFPDNYKFWGKKITDKHKQATQEQKDQWEVKRKHTQIGNAVPPPMAREIGYEIKKCILRKMREDEAKAPAQVKQEVAMDADPAQEESKAARQEDKPVPEEEPAGCSSSAN